MNFESIFFDTALPLASATLLGGLLGFERELRGRFAGLRTHIMVATSSAMFVLAGMAFVPASGPELSRIIQGIAAGVGFIGAGTVLKLREHAEVKGLTTASSIWMAAAVGTASGVKLYGLAICGTVLALIVLTGVLSAEKYFESNSPDASPKP
jgi:putative Mg2+ transporter-C (MgtC) family protein